MNFRSFTDISNKKTFVRQRCIARSQEYRRAALGKSFQSSDFNFGRILHFFLRSLRKAPRSKARRSFLFCVYTSIQLASKQQMIIRNITTFFLCLGMTFFQAYPFTTQKQYTKIRLSQQRRKDPCYRRQHRLQAKDSEGSEDSGIPQLPAIGASSFSTNSKSSSSSHNFQQASEGENQPTDAAFVSPKFELQYTCKVCDTRNCHLVSRIGTFTLLGCCTWHSNRWLCCVARSLTLKCFFFTSTLLFNIKQ